jgi:hypothetical protein
LGWQLVIGNGLRLRRFPKKKQRSRVLSSVCSLGASKTTVSSDRSLTMRTSSQLQIKIHEQTKMLKVVVFKTGPFDFSESFSVKNLVLSGSAARRNCPHLYGKAIGEVDPSAVFL